MIRDGQTGEKGALHDQQDKEVEAAEEFNAISIIILMVFILMPEVMLFIPIIYAKEV